MSLNSAAKVKGREGKGEHERLIQSGGSPLQLNLDLPILGLDEVVPLIDSLVANNIGEANTDVSKRFLM